MVIVIAVLVVKREVQYPDDVHRLQPIVPLPLVSLFPNRKRRIIKTAVLEKLLLPALHLHQNLLTLLVLAIHVENRAAVSLARPKMLRVKVSQILDLLLPSQQTVDETLQQVLVHLGPEQLLETEIRVRIHIPVRKIFSYHGLCS